MDRNNLIATDSWLSIHGVNYFVLTNTQPRDRDSDATIHHAIASRALMDASLTC